MRYLLEQSRLQHLIKSRNGYLILAIGSTIINTLLVVFIFFMVGRERIVMVPPEIQKSFWITSGTVSPEYLSEMALFFTSLSFNVSPGSATMQHAILLRYVDPTYYEILKRKLVDVEERIKKEHITTSFYPGEVKVDTKHFIVQVSGDLQYTIGDVQLPLEHVTYQYGFSYKQAQLKITSFPEVKNHA
jgi:conjugal transfer pilus assembly protein TraE